MSVLGLIQPQGCHRPINVCYYMLLLLPLTYSILTSCGLVELTCVRNPTMHRPSKSSCSQSAAAERQFFTSSLSELSMINLSVFSLRFFSASLLRGNGVAAFCDVMLPRCALYKVFATRFILPLVELFQLPATIL